MPEILRDVTLDTSLDGSARRGQWSWLHGSVRASPPAFWCSLRSSPSRWRQPPRQPPTSREHRSTVPRTSVTRKIRPTRAPADLPLAGSRAGVGRGHPGRPGAPVGFADDWDPVPEMPDFPELPDLLPALPDPPSHLPGAPQPHHPSPPPTDAASPPESAQEPPDEGRDAPEAESPQPSEPTGLPEADDAQIPPAPAGPSPAPSPSASRSAPKQAAPAKPPRRPEARERFVAPGAPRQTPGTSEGQGRHHAGWSRSGPGGRGQSVHLRSAGSAG